MNEKLVGNKSEFAIEFAFLDGGHDTEIAMYVEGENILAFERNGEQLTTRWDLDELAEWLRRFIDNMAEDPYPVDCKGEYAAQKDDAARDFDSDNDAEFEAYYDTLYAWNQRHRWHSASAGAILADVFFQLVGEFVEISWDNEDMDEGVTFQYLTGGAKIKKEHFCEVVDRFLKAYAAHWFS